MKKYCILLLVLLFAVSCKPSEDKKDSVPAHNTLTDAEKANGWILLFDGETFKGWRGIGIEGIPQGHWEIEDGTIKKVASGNVPKLPDGQPAKGGDLMTEKTFTNFELSFEWKISNAGNSGVKYNVIEEVSIKNGSSSALGFEYQVLDDENHSDNSNPTHLSASLYDMIQAKGKSVNKVGEFNSAKIVFNNGHGEHWLNGEKVVEFDNNTEEFMELYRKSKYHKLENFINHKAGNIILQDHGDKSWYRNIKIKEL